MLTIYLVPLVDLDEASYPVARKICLEHGGCYIGAPIGSRNGRYKFPAGYAFGNPERAIDAEAAIARAFLDTDK